MGMGLEEGNSAAFGGSEHSSSSSQHPQRGTAELQVVLIFQLGESEEKWEKLILCTAPFKVYVIRGKAIYATRICQLLS